MNYIVWMKMAAMHECLRAHVRMMGMEYPWWNAAVYTDWSFFGRCGQAWWDREAHLQLKMYRSTLWSSEVEKLHAGVARSTFPSQKVKKLTVSQHFLKFRRRKIARPCGEKHMCKSKCTKYFCFGTFLKFRCRKVSQLASSSVNHLVSQLVR